MVLPALRVGEEELHAGRVPGRDIVASRLEGAPHETLLVVDATTGQNGLQQARLFAEAVGVSGVVLKTRSADMLVDSLPDSLERTRR